MYNVITSTITYTINKYPTHKTGGAPGWREEMQSEANQISVPSLFCHMPHDLLLLFICYASILYFLKIFSIFIIMLEILYCFHARADVCPCQNVS